MGHYHCTGKASGYKHLSYKDRLTIEVLHRAKQGTRAIAEVVGCSQRTIQRELKRGMVQQHDGQTWLYYQRYSAEKAQQDAALQATGKGPGLKIGKDHRLAATIERCVKAGESPDVIAWRIKSEADESSVTLCTKTIYNYLYANLFLNVSWQDLILGPYKKRQGRRYNRPSYHKIQGRSIEDRPTQVDARSEKGHWEMDLVLGRRGSRRCLLTLTERKTRRAIVRRLPNKTQASVVQALDRIERELGAQGFRDTFRTITVDNGSEFLGTPELERSCLQRKRQRTQVYYAHPYSAWERGSNENLNRMIRRFIPKGSDISRFTQQEINRLEQWLNVYPRKILNYLTPAEAWAMST